MPGTMNVRAKLVAIAIVLGVATVAAAVSESDPVSAAFNPIATVEHSAQRIEFQPVRNVAPGVTVVPGGALDR